MSTLRFDIGSNDPYSTYDILATRLLDGRVVALWNADGKDGTGNGLFFSILGQDGTDVGTETMVIADATTDPSYRFGITALNEGGFLVTYSQLYNPTPGFSYDQIFVQRVDDDGQHIGAPILVTLADQGYRAKSVALDTGGWVTGFFENKQYLLQFYDVLGQKTGAEVVLADYTGQAPSGQFELLSLANGTLMVAWSDPANNNDIRLGLYGMDGSVIKSDVNVNPADTAGNHGDFQLVQLSDQTVLVTWQEDFDLYARLYSQGRVSKGPAFVLHDDNSGYRVSALGDKFLVTFNDSGESRFVAFENDGTVIADWSLRMEVSPSAARETVALEGGGFLFLDTVIADGHSQLMGAVHMQATAIDDYVTLHSGGLFNALAGDDLVNGSDEDDIIVGGAGQDTVFAGDGDDIVWTGGGVGLLEIAYGGAGNDHIRDIAGQSRLDGGTGDDILTAAEGDDTLDGGTGDDRLHGNAGNDRMLGDIGNDRFWGGDGNDTILGGGGIDRAYGGAGDDQIEGGDGYDRLIGEEGNDILLGGGGNDYLHGGLGNDVMSGGLGIDSFVFDIAGFGADAITDWEPGEQVQILSTIATSATLEVTGSTVTLSFAGGTVDLLNAAGFDPGTDVIFI